MELAAAPADVREAFREGRFSLKHALALARIEDPARRELFIRRAGVRRLRSVEAGAHDAARGVPDGVESEAEEGVPEKIRSFVRVARTPNPEFPRRVSVLLKDDAQVERLLKYLVRFA